jgi:hypothetical protein
MRIPFLLPIPIYEESNLCGISELGIRPIELKIYWVMIGLLGHVFMFQVVLNPSCIRNCLSRVLYSQLKFPGTGLYDNERNF